MEQGRVRAEDRLGSVEADTAADLGRKHQTEAVLDIRLALVNARELCCPIVLQLHWFMIAISRVSVNHDGRGGTAPDPRVWDLGSLAKQRKVDIWANVDLAMLPGPPEVLCGPWVQVDGRRITGADVAAWPYSVSLSLLCEFPSSLGSLHWPAETADLGHYGGLLFGGFDSLWAVGWPPVAQ